MGAAALQQQLLIRKTSAMGVKGNQNIDSFYVRISLEL